jgi:hypothetical protein
MVMPHGVENFLSVLVNASEEKDLLSLQSVETR